MRLKFYVILAGSALTSSLANADPEIFDTIHPYVTYSETTSSNVLDLASSAQALQVLGTTDMSDRWRTEIFGVALDDQIGLQHFTADLNRSHIDFERFNELNYDSTSAQGNWKWAVGTHVTGDLGASYSDSPTSFAYFHELQQPFLDTKQQNFDIAWLFHPSWRLVANVTGYEIEYQVPVQQEYSRNEYHTLGGIDYLSANGSSFGIVTGTLRTYFPFPQQFGDDEIVNNSKQKEFKFNVNWNISGLSSLQFLGGWVDRKFDVLKQDDYRGWNDRATLNWIPDDTSGIVFTTWREIGAIDLLTTVYAVNRGYSLAPYWQFTSKLTLQGKYAVELHDFAETIQPFGLPSYSLRSETHTGTLMLNYQMTNHWNFQLSWYRNSQVTNDHSNDFVADGIQGLTTFKF